MSRLRCVTCEAHLTQQQCALASLGGDEWTVGRKKEKSERRRGGGRGHVCTHVKYGGYSKNSGKVNSVIACFPFLRLAVECALPAAAGVCRAARVREEKTAILFILVILISIFSRNVT